MATTNDISKQMDMAGLALKIKDVDMSGNADITGNVTVTGTLAVAGNSLSKGSGVSAMESYAAGFSRTGTFVTTQIVFDMTGLVGSATDNDIIGNTGGAASCHLGQVTAALNGTLVGGLITCLEVPAGGAADINFYSANESTGAQDALATGLTETVLLDNGGNWTAALQKAMTGLPPANDYLYIANGAASGGTFSAGKFLIELYGYIA